MSHTEYMCPNCEGKVDSIEPSKVLFAELRGLTYAMNINLSMPVCMNCLAKLLFTFALSYGLKEEDINPLHENYTGD